MKKEITFEDYSKVQILVGTVLKVSKNEKKTFKAILKSVENDSLELGLGNEELTIDFGIIDMCKLMPNYKEILREKNKFLRILLLSLYITIIGGFTSLYIVIPSI